VIRVFTDVRAYHRATFSTLSPSILRFYFFNENAFVRFSIKLFFSALHVNDDDDDDDDDDDV